MTAAHDFAVLTFLVRGSSFVMAAYAARHVPNWLGFPWWLAFLVLLLACWIATHILVHRIIAGLLAE